MPARTASRASMRSQPFINRESYGVWRWRTWARTARSDEAVDDLLVELRECATRFFREPARFMATSRGAHAAALLRFALADANEQRRMLGVEKPEPEPAAVDGR